MPDRKLLEQALEGKTIGNTINIRIPNSLKCPEPSFISMLTHKDVLYVATSEGVYAKDGNGTFHKLKIGE